MGLSIKEAEYLQDVLEWWIEGYEDATTDTVNDTLGVAETPEQYLQAVDGIVKDFDTGVTIKMRLQDLLKRKKSDHGHADEDADCVSSDGEGS